MDIETYLDGISGSLSWCAIVDDTIEEAGFVIGGGETYVFQNIYYQVLPVLGRLPQAVQCFIEYPEVVGTGVGIAKGWVDDDDLVLWE